MAAMACRVIRTAASASACILATPADVAAHSGGKLHGPHIEQPGDAADPIYGRLGGGRDDGEDRITLEVLHAIDALELGVNAEVEREVGGSRSFASLGFQATYGLGMAGGIEVGLYGAYETIFGTADRAEAQLLFARTAGPLNARLDLIAEHRLDGGAIAFSYSTSADVPASGGVRLGLAGFGELGTSRRLTTRGEHFVGPNASIALPGTGRPLALQAGYLFAIGTARGSSPGQMRVVIELEL